jgi:hypothetical protein
LLVRGIFPLAVVGKRTLPIILAIVLPLGLAACGGASKNAKPAGQSVVKGLGFQFVAPAGWTTKATGAAMEARPAAAAGAALVSATAFALLKPYSPSLFARVAKELDRVAAKLAAQSRSSLAESKTITVDGRRVRAYRLTVHPASGPSFDERIGFVLHGKKEYQLLCRAPVGAGDPDGACALLYSSFKIVP